MSFEIGDLVRCLHGDRELGRVFDVRDYGVEICVRRLGPCDSSRRIFYTYFDQLEAVNILDLMSNPPEWWTDDCLESG